MSCAFDPRHATAYATSRSLSIFVFSTRLNARLLVAQTLKAKGYMLLLLWQVLNESKKTDKTLVKAIVVLLRNTTWRCGRLERLIVKHLHRKNVMLGKPEMSVNDMVRSLKLTGKKKNEFLDAMKRLERRNIVRILKL
jgi:hypothetical protein